MDFNTFSILTQSVKLVSPKKLGETETNRALSIKLKQAKS